MRFAPTYGALLAIFGLLPQAHGQMAGPSAAAVDLQAISVPKGQGSVEGMGDRFQTETATGTGSFRLPFSLPKARGAAQPSLALSYSTASAMGQSGVGFHLGVPFIARDTHHGPPIYPVDPPTGVHPNQDRFVWLGATELVPLCVVQGLVCPAAPSERLPTWASGWVYYRAHIEESFLRFFLSPDRRTWRVQDQTGTTMELGVPLDGTQGTGRTDALETDPDNPAHIARWNIARHFDTEGDGLALQGPVVRPRNVVVYTYFQDGATAYLSDVYDTPPTKNAETAPLVAYAHHAHLRYGSRPDPRASYKRGYETRTALRLVGLDVTSKGDTDGPRELLRRYHLSYSSKERISLLERVQLEGRCPQAMPESTAGLLAGTTSCPRMPPLTFSYTSGGRPGGKAMAHDGFGTFESTLEPLPQAPGLSLETSNLDFFDVNGDALPDLVRTEAASGAPEHGVWFQGQGGTLGTFGPLTPMGMGPGTSVQSASLLFRRPEVVPLDVDGNGRLDLFFGPLGSEAWVFEPSRQGSAWQWLGRKAPSLATATGLLDLTGQRKNMRVVDINGDGLVDLLQTEGTTLRSYLNLGRLPGGDGRFGQGAWTGPGIANLSSTPFETCSPGDGQVIDLSQTSIVLSDMNGDGLADLVRLLPGLVEYWPGRGNGRFGLRQPFRCDPTRPPTSAASVVMVGAPSLSPGPSTFVRPVDVDGDGLDDLLAVQGREVSIYFNVAGTSFGPTPLRLAVDGAPSVPAAALRLADVNGSGSRDIVWGSPGHYTYLDLLGGVRPRLLARIDSGLGKTTEMTYASVASLQTAADAQGKAWTRTMPTAAHVLVRVAVSDNLPLAGRPASRYVTDLSYRDPVFDGQSRAFRGFREALERTLGDATSPPVSTRTVYLTGDCIDETPGDAVADCEAPGRWRDNPREALKSHPALVELFDDKGVYLSTAQTTYGLRDLAVGLDGRTVQYAYAKRKDTWSYEGSRFPGTPKTFPLPPVEREGPQGLPLTSSVSAVAPAGDRIDVTLRSTVGTVHGRSHIEVDDEGHTVLSVAEGCVEGCLTADESVAKSTQWGHLSENPWIHRPLRTWVQGSRTAERRHEKVFHYNERGHLLETRAELTGTGSLDRFHEDSTRAVAPTPSTATPNGEVVLSATDYDAFGNGVFLRTAENGCRQVLFDERYGTLVVGELVRVGPVGPDPNAGGTSSAAFASTRAGAGCGTTVLPSLAIYDRGLGLPVETVGLHGERTKAAYDGFGRITALWQSDPQQVGAVVQEPSVLIDYDVDSTGLRPYSRLRTRIFDGKGPGQLSYRSTWTYVDGLGRTFLTLSEGDTNTGDKGPWLASGLTHYNAKGQPLYVYLPWFSQSDPATISLADGPPTAFTTHRYDAFGREVEVVDTAGDVTLSRVHHASSVDTWDASDLRSPQHQGTFATTRYDGHGRVVMEVERLREGGVLKEVETRHEYLPSGEEVRVSRSLVGGTTLLSSRWIQFDSQGHMVLNAEPHTSKGLSASGPAASPGLKAWRYVYDNAGRLVGTSDARGCGANYMYDAGGRPVATDYSPCEVHHALYTEPNLVTGDGTEVFTRYDTPDESPMAGCSPAADTLLGRVASVWDRGARSVMAYDGRGRTTCVGRQVAKPGAPATLLAERYAQDEFVSTTTYDLVDRPLTTTTGAKTPELLGTDGTSSLRMAYAKRGGLATVDSSYGPLVTNLVRTADGRVESVVYGDLARTRTDYTYDEKLRVRSVQTYRGPPPLWSQPSPGITPPTAESTRQAVLEDTVYTYDETDNPTTITDGRSPNDWPAGAKPVARRMEYDDLGRLTRLRYEGSGGADPWVSPLAAEQAQGSTTPLPQQTFSHRMTEQSFAYDVLGNIVESHDDADGFFDRSLGKGTFDRAKPYQLTSASAAQGHLSAVYNSAGSTTALAVQRKGPCLPVGALCSHRFAYDWDELGQLVRARRWDLTDPGQGTDDVPAGTPSVDLSYAYDGAGTRVRKTATVGTDARHTVYALTTLDLRSTTFDGTDYRRDSETEVAYLAAHGLRLGRVVAREASDAGAAPGGSSPGSAGGNVVPNAGGPRVFLELADALGSTSTVVDLDTSELVEKTTYSAYGTTESDYRPERWGHFREDYKFTGKEEDIEVGLSYFGYRYYAPTLGRWLSADPLAVHSPGQADGNLYAYVRGRVLRSVDPLGLVDDGFHAYDSPADMPTRDAPSAPAPTAGDALGQQASREVTLQQQAAPPWWQAPVTRAMGALRTVFGGTEMVVGGGLVVAPEPTITKVGGAALVVHGADSVSTGVREMWTGEPQESGTHALVRKGLTAASVAEKTASTVATVVDGVAGVGAGVGVGMARAASAGAAAAAEGAAVRGGMSAAGAEVSAAGGADLGRKLDYFLGRATGSPHNVERSIGMLRQLESAGLSDSPTTREYLADHLRVVASDPSNIAKVQDNGRVVRESLLMGPRGSLKFETVWEGAKLITGNLFGGR